ncbi:PBECR4 domain-containing protein [uncultured Parasutterella sp.]|uniref:PBECR4 domain-containing protein n=1 Tax=uncultured Parasutterella sp. TaxID=1263098 RepID=UPI00344CCF6A
MFKRSCLTVLNNLENYLDSDQLIFRYLEEKSFSKIKADYLLENHLNDSVSYLFIAKNNNCFVGISLFEKRMIRVSDKILENLRLNCEVFI